MATINKSFIQLYTDNVPLNPKKKARTTCSQELAPLHQKAAKILQAETLPFWTKLWLITLLICTIALQNSQPQSELTHRNVIQICFSLLEATWFWESEMNEKFRKRHVSCHGNTGVIKQCWLQLTFSANKYNQFCSYTQNKHFKILVRAWSENKQLPNKKSQCL